MSDDKAMRLLENLTPGGSEFFENPDRCAEWVERRLSESHRITVAAVIARNAAEADLTASREREAALADILDRLATGYENLAELRLLDNPYLDETMRLVDAARAALAASSAAGKVEQDDQ